VNELLSVTVNGRAVEVPAGCTAAVALAIAGVDFARLSVSGAPRAPVCGMGICFECCATIDGRSHQRTCQTVCRPGMEIRTDGD
jgi:predicted molibdopterin-dependent oxidoreductase YjgC